jgi:hypothetical protein
MHPFDVVVRVLAERLAGGTPSEALSAALAGDAVSWERMVEQASEQFVLAAFAAALRDLDLVPGLEPEVGQFLHAVHSANAERNARLRRQLTEILSTLNQTGIEPVLLKGAIRLADQLYPDPGWRMMQDLDVLVPKAKLKNAVWALRKDGYVIAPGPHRHSSPDAHHHYPGLVHPERCAPVELHTRLFPPIRTRLLLEAGEVLEHAQPMRVDGTRTRLPSLEHQMIHLIGHCQIAHYGHIHGRIELRDRLEAAALVRWSSGTLAWERILARFAVVDYRRPMLTFLLSLRDGGLCTVPAPARIDGVTALQAWRVAMQARSATAMRLGRDAALLKEEMLERGAGWRTVLGMLVRRLTGGQAASPR